ncbi:MAG: 50S ribosomal protein L19 [Verrucomicrobiota bacterium]|nr:50S ribosomal protein L19 [Verrucomicrobiota bacterium]
MNNIIANINKDQLKTDLPEILSGDTVNVHIDISEKSAEKAQVKIQVFKGIVIALNGSGISRTITVRKISFGKGVEKIIPLHSPKIKEIEIVSHAKVRRAKQYFLRDRKGKAARLKREIRSKKKA